MLPDVRLALAPDTALVPLAFVCGGVALGVCSGLVPGLYANNMALLLAAAASDVPGPPRFVAAAMLAAGVVHTFLDAVPALALGVPDPAMAASALPGHRLVVEGRGREALRLSALGSGLAVVLAVGDRYLRAVGHLDSTRLSVGVLCLLAALSWLLAGVVGVAAFLAAAVVGLVPARFGARRVHHMGC